MNIISDIDFYDFYFNGHYLSEFGGYVGSTSGGLKTYSLLPSRSFTTDKPLNYDGEIVFESRLEPRKFNVPVVFDDIDEVGIRKIASWLDVQNDTMFFFRDDNLYLNVSINSQDCDFDTISGVDGEIDIAFIAHDPYFYDRNLTKYSITDVEKDRKYAIINSGSVESFPTITVTNEDTFTINLFDRNRKLIQSFTVEYPNGTVVIDSKYCTCSRGDKNLFNYINGEFLNIPSGVSYISFSKDVESVNIEFRPRSK